MDISPRRTPRGTPPRWRKPAEVMKEHSLKVKETALLARMNQQESSTKDISFPVKRKNPFSCRLVENGTKKPREESVGEDSLLKILGVSQPQLPASLPKVEYTPSLPALLTPRKEAVGEVLTRLPVDWTLRTKMRFISAQPFPWKLPLKTCEEASGITGFVRCRDWSAAESTGVDTSVGGQLHHSSLVWLQPYLPWLPAFPRHSTAGQTKAGGLRKTSPPLHQDPTVREALRQDWAKSLRSLFQLVRARHCPYFYMVSERWNCLFRAPGINRTPQLSVLIAPVSKSFIKLLTDDGITFKEPRLTEERRGELGGEEAGRSGTGGDVETGEDETELEGMIEEDQNDWLSSLGLTHICETPDSKDGLRKSGNEERMICVEGSDAQALVNFLINCKSVVSRGGALAGLPPTLISPVAFPGGTLTTLKVCESTVKVEGERFNTLEVQGPILPCAVLNFTSLLDRRLATFSVTFASIESTKAFSQLGDVEGEEGSPEKTSSAFDEGALSESGLSSSGLAAFCSSKPRAYDSARYSEGTYRLS